MPLSLIWAGIVCAGMLFFIAIEAIAQFSLIYLLIFVPIFFFYMTFLSVKNTLKTQKQQIDNALEVWKNLGNDYFELKTKLKNTKSNIPIMSIWLNN